MTDPAKEAAHRAWRATGAAGDDAERGAREALAPLRDLHRPYAGRDDGRVVCSHCLGPIAWPCTTALYIYTTEELKP